MKSQIVLKFFVSKNYHIDSILANPITKFGKVFENHNPDLLHMCDLVLPILKYFYDKCGVNLDDTNIDNIIDSFGGYDNYHLSTDTIQRSLQRYIKKCLSNKNLNNFPKFKLNDRVYFPLFKLDGVIILSYNYFQVGNLLNIKNLFEKFFFGLFTNLNDVHTIMNDLLIFYVDPNYVERKMMEHMKNLRNNKNDENYDPI